MNLRPTMLDDTSWFTPFIETFTSEKLPWAATGAPHSYETCPPYEAFDGLIQDYGAQAAT